MEAYLGEIRMFAGNYAPQGWHLCDGSLLPISQNEALFTLLGTTYGGDGVSTFALPDLRGRAPVGQGRSTASGNTYVIGQQAGSESVTLTTNQIPVHSHTPLASSAATAASPAGAVWGSGETIEYVDPDSTVAAMNASSVSATGGNLPHNNMMPYLPIGFIIALVGIYPSQN